MPMLTGRVDLRHTIRNDEKKLTAQHHNFMNVVRIFEINDRLSRCSLPNLYRNHTTFTHIPHNVTQVDDVSDKIGNCVRRQSRLGVLINHAWPNMSSSVTSFAQVKRLAQYCAFNSTQEITAYADTIVSDIVYEAALLASNLYSSSNAGALPHSLV
ncbi:hypothetical protein NW752_007686 [Fusarium irregulare]|uniref:Uncharacterized protein n=1 Tax=Fusarium irregulare TaxID=2494466 RepID=A0A9W8U6Y7_9HYPO|nr:hypothetical protein NW766_010020 [Fusarium irregulare]KAJ4013389.1 hypothetical protein NW752_007686 [Fusarium irregulare]